jgi:DNA repair protein RadC
MAKSISTSSSRAGDDRRKAIMKISNAIGELKISYRTTHAPYGKITNSLAAYEFLRKVWDMDLIEYQEQFCLICLSRANYIIGYEFISTGGSAGTVVDAKLVFQASLLANASSIILAHNHPSGNLTPSEQDDRLTRRLTTVGRSIDIPVIEHVIISKDGYFSFADEGRL